MQEKIQYYLDKLEKEKQIKILLAVETGSRAWGFPSPDSDYDIRIIYAHKPDWYLSVNEKRDSIELMAENNDIDITGWDLRKALRLMLKSNAALTERVQSSIVYREDDAFAVEVYDLCQSHYSRIAVVHHYLSMGNNMRSEINPESPYKLKKFFYALRCALVSEWITEREEMPPIDFRKIYPNLGLKEKSVRRITELIELKGTASESYLHSGEEELFSLMDRCLVKAKEVSQGLPSAKKDPKRVDTFFRKYIQW